MTKTIEARFKKLTEVEHVLKRPGRYIGVTEPKVVDTYIIKNDAIEWCSAVYSPAFLKLFDEIISNSADFSKTAEGKHVNKIEVTIDRTKGTISVLDNGGIPVVKHTEYDQYVPDMIFGELRSGSNFDDADDSVTTGQNGEGSTLTNIFSTEFIVDTADGKNRFLCGYYDNMHRRDVPKVTKSSKNYTQITYTPDYSRLGITLDDWHVAMLERRVYEIAATNNHLKVYLNGTLLNFKTFKDYVALFNKNAISFGNDRFQASVFHSKSGFQQINFVNSTNVFQGGTHVDALMNTIVAGVREHVKKKTKQDIKPSDIKNHFFLMGTFTINNPRYNSQTKEYLQTAVKDFGMSLEVPDKVLQQIIKSDIVQEIIEWAENKKAIEDLAALKKKNKDLDKSGTGALRAITKYESATSKVRNKCALFIAEGDSAAKALQSARDPEFHGVFPLKGKPVNVRGMKIKDLIANEELESLMTIIGLQFGVEPKISDLRYSSMIISTDQDLDGFHLASLLYNMFVELWPGLVKQGFLFKLQTPIVRVTQGKKEIEFFTLEEYYKWETKQSKHNYSTTYLKGLGSNDTKYFKEYMFKDEYKTPIVYKDAADKDALDIAFDESKADERKLFIYGDNK
ncbi:DNA topoisomerase II large subunit [Xanthomonas phage Xoo-sp13]|nr:DNA topoisomerase II large subunit [Xanthomonas phage Xoo-sp13]